MEDRRGKGGTEALGRGAIEGELEGELEGVVKDGIQNRACGRWGGSAVSV